MKVVILAGGLGTRISEYSNVMPKPMVEIGGHPILWHIMNIYASYGFDDFIIALGYKGEVIKKYFLNFNALNSDLRIDLSSGKVENINSNVKNWKVTLVETGKYSLTGGRIKKLSEYLDKETFMVTYGDAVSDINIKDLLEFHKKNKKIATVTAVHPPARFGEILVDDMSRVTSFKEKPQTNLGWINGGFFVFQPEFLNYIDNDLTVLEKEPLENIVLKEELMAFKHDGFWQSMDTVRDKKILDDICEKKTVPWMKRVNFND